MRVIIDRAGRILIPKPLRDALGLRPGQQVEIAAREGGIEIQPVPTPLGLVERDGVLVAEPEEPLPPLTVDRVRGTLERVRRRSSPSPPA